MPSSSGIASLLSFASTERTHLGEILGKVVSLDTAPPPRTLDISNSLKAPKNTLSALKRLLHVLQSTIMSANPPACPLASHTFGFMMIAQSTPTIAISCPSGPGGGLRTMSCHQAS